jgi:DNA-binding response OmpR family regulator
MPIKIVYVDDEPDLCEMFADLFSSPDILVTTYTNPDLAIEEIRKNPPDLIFLDYRLPKTNGDKIALELANHIPKVLVTGDVAVKTEYPFLKHFGKPYTRAEILKFISEIRAKLKPA